ncbi:MAG: carboxymuconolactone decarboxylase family protein [Planctomycetota bacterium]|nr:carboxymuconolactone decarboxylase family protein [Planctomycetota bacterium]
MAWIKTIEPDEASGLLQREYDRAMARAERVANVVKLTSLDPPMLNKWIENFLAVMHGPSPLSRGEREMVAVVVSQLNSCHY